MTLGNVVVGFLVVILLIIAWALAQGIGQVFGSGITEVLTP